MNNNKLIIVAGVVAALMIAQTLWLMRYADKRNKTGYILTQKVFDGFDGTKQIKSKLQNQENRQKQVIDSLTMEYKLVASLPDAASKVKATRIKEVYNSLYMQFQKQSEDDVKKYNADIWKQINQYVNEYGKENNYGILYGADGTGSLMYADSTLNISDKVIKYINKKYAGE